MSNSRVLFLITPDILQRSLVDDIVDYIKSNLFINGFVNREEMRSELRVVKRGRLSNKEVKHLLDDVYEDEVDDNIVRSFYQRHESVIAEIKLRNSEVDPYGYLKVLEQELRDTYGIDSIRNSVNFLTTNFIN